MKSRRFWIFIFIFKLLTCAVEVLAVSNSKTELFAQGAESFVLENNVGGPLKKQLLVDTPTKQAVAAALVQYLNSKPETKPKVPVQQGIPVHFEKLTFIPEGKTDLLLVARVSGHDFEISQKIDRQEFLAGKSVALKFNPLQKDLSPFMLKFRGGQFHLRLDPQKKELLIEDGTAELDFEIPFAGEESESLKFSGRGKRL